MRTRLRPVAVLACLLALGLIAAGCGDSGDKGGSSPDDAQALLKKSFEKPVPSADIDLDAAVDLQGIPGLSGPIGFRLQGPYASNGEKKIPSLDWNVGIKVLGQTLTGALVLSPETAYVNFQNQDYALEQSTFSVFQKAYANQASQTSTATGGIFKSLGIDPASWLTDAKISDGPDIGGDSTRKITGTVNVGVMVNDIFELAKSPKVRKQLESTGTPVPSVPKLTEKQLAQIKDAIKTATIEVDVDDNDVARRMAGDIAFEIPQGANAGSLEGGSVKIAYTLGKLGVKVDPKPPTNPKPLKDLISGFSGLLGGFGGTQQ